MKVKMPQMSTMPNCLRTERFCCCLCSLKSGTLFIGIVYTLISLLTVSAIFTYDPSFDNNATKGLLGYEFGIHVIWLVVNLALLYGTVNDQSDFIAPWIGWHMVLFFLQIIVAIWAGNILVDEVETYAIELASLIIAILINTGTLLFFWITVNSYYIYLREEEQSLFRFLTTRFEIPIPVHNGRIFRDSRPSQDSFTSEYTPKPWETQEPSPNALRPWSNPVPIDQTRDIPKPRKEEEPSDQNTPHQRPLPIRRPLINAMNNKSGNMRQLPQKVLPPLPPRIPDASMNQKSKPRGIPDRQLWLTQNDSSLDNAKEETAPEEIPYREPCIRKESDGETKYLEPWIDESGKTGKNKSLEYDYAYQETSSSQESVPKSIRMRLQESSEEDISYDQLWTPHRSPSEGEYIDPQTVVKRPFQTDC
ncbi:hypothetical protein C0J52_02573 [Blattella germanica]|nr:hypothetical protein C0J52_02573 [Blattella germanica]